MLTIRDCIDFSDLSEEEILAIAECEHIPLMNALEEGESMVHTARGRKQIAHIIKDQADLCARNGNAVHALQLMEVYETFVKRFEGK
ncbi:hypothetical protein LPB41_28915 [Thalassospira sp. MA62]|nr:hypothetical protein [Thalassospira sp. MA62]